MHYLSIYFTTTNILKKYRWHLTIELNSGLNMTMGVMQAEPCNHPAVDVHHELGAVLAGASMDMDPGLERDVNWTSDMYIVGWEEIKWRPPTPKATPDHNEGDSELDRAFNETPDLVAETSVS